MANYPIKMLKDENNTPFVPLVGTDAIVDPEGKTLEERLLTKLGPDNLKAGDYVNVRTEGYDCYIDVDLPSGLTLIDNLETETSGQGSLDAHQGKVLKDSIPDIVNNLTTIDTNKGLSAYQGYLLNNKFNNYTTTTDMNTKFDKYLPLTGGSLTGLFYLNGTGSTGASSTSYLIFGNSTNQYASLSANTSSQLIFSKLQSDTTKGFLMDFGNSTFRPASDNTTGILGNSSYRWANLYSKYINVSGDATIDGDLLLGKGNGSIYWNGGTVRQRIQTTDDSTAGTAVFTFQQSGDSGSNWANLMTILDNGNVTIPGTMTANAIVSNSGFGKKYTFTKSVTIGSDWTDVGLAYNDLPAGAYIVFMTGIYDTNMSWQQGNNYAGMMSWYASTTNATESCEIPLHTTGHAHNGYTISLRTRNYAGSEGKNTRMEIKSSTAFSRATSIQFIFVKMV